MRSQEKLFLLFPQNLEKNDLFYAVFEAPEKS
jgi:hypothetical protein